MKKRIKISICFRLCLIGFTLVSGCKRNLETKDTPASAKTDLIIETKLQSNSTNARLIFSLALDQRVYDFSDYGEPPQFAIWLEDPNSDEIRTVWVTYRTAANKWKGKIECPVSLPYWRSRFNKKTQTTDSPTFHRPVPDAVTGATPTHAFTISSETVKNSTWNYFIEVNVSGDYTRDFPSTRLNGAPDFHGNGQPSIVYKGIIKVINNEYNIPELIGRTDQWQQIDHLITDTEGITSAKKLLSSIEVRCRYLQ